MIELEDTPYKEFDITCFRGYEQVQINCFDEYISKLTETEDKRTFLIELLAIYDFLKDFGSKINEYHINAFLKGMNKYIVNNNAARLFLDNKDKLYPRKAIKGKFKNTFRVNKHLIAKYIIAKLIQHELIEEPTDILDIIAKNVEPLAKKYNGSLTNIFNQRELSQKKFKDIKLMLPRLVIYDMNKSTSDQLDNYIHRVLVKFKDNIDAGNTGESSEEKDKDFKSKCNDKIPVNSSVHIDRGCNPDVILQQKIIRKIDDYKYNSCTEEISFGLYKYRKNIKNSIHEVMNIINKLRPTFKNIKRTYRPRALTDTTMTDVSREASQYFKSRETSQTGGGYRQSLKRPYNDDDDDDDDSKYVSKIGNENETIDTDVEIFLIFSLKRAGDWLQCILASQLYALLYTSDIFCMIYMISIGGCVNYNKHIFNSKPPDNYTSYRLKWLHYTDKSNKVKVEDIYFKKYKKYKYKYMQLQKKMNLL